MLGRGRGCGGWGTLAGPPRTGCGESIYARLVDENQSFIWYLFSNRDDDQSLTLESESSVQIFLSLSLYLSLLLLSMLLYHLKASERLAGHVGACTIAIKIEIRPKG